MRIGTKARRLACALGMGVGLAAAAPSLVAVARIEPGRWRIKTVGADEPPRLLCVANPMLFLHYNRHGRGCEHDVVVNDPDTATVQYRCGDATSGSVTLHVATPRAFNLDMQGLEGGSPYEDRYEAHRLGDCAAPRVPAR